MNQGPRDPKPMSINLDKHFGVHAQAMQLRSQRNEVLATNIANADTPGYKARDLDFSAVLRQTAPGGENLRLTHVRHLDANGAGNGEPRLMYRIATQPTQDGNTVDMQQEQATFAENAVRYQASLEFLNSRIRGLLTAIKGQSQ